MTCVQFAAAKLTHTHILWAQIVAGRTTERVLARPAMCANKQQKRNTGWRG